MRDDACRRVFRRLPMNDCPENMAENIESVIVKVEEDEALQQAVKVNGRYVDPCCSDVLRCAQMEVTREE